jgi:hypothetical protein
MTDELRAYRGIGRRFAGHDTVRHEEEEWSRKLDDGTKAHVNTVEGFFSILKRGIYGCYFHVSEKHLHRYLAEVDFRYSHRSALGVEDATRIDRATKGDKGKRLTYETNSWRTGGRRRNSVLDPVAVVAREHRRPIRASFGCHLSTGTSDDARPRLRYPGVATRHRERNYACYAVPNSSEASFGARLESVSSTSSPAWLPAAGRRTRGWPMASPVARLSGFA